MRRSLIVLAVLAIGAGAPSAPTPHGANAPAANLKRPGLARPLPLNDSGRKPGRPVPGRGSSSGAGGRRASGNTPSPSVAVTVQVIPGQGPGPETPPDVSFYLGPSRPNPFHTTTQIIFTNPVRARAKLVVYDVQGMRVSTLLDAVLDPGPYAVTWNGAGDAGKILPPGVYMYRLTIGRHESVKKVVFTH